MAFRNGAVIAMVQQQAEQQQQAAASARAHASEFRPTFAMSISDALVRVASTSSSSRDRRHNRGALSISSSSSSTVGSSSHTRSSSVDFGSLNRLRRNAFASSKGHRQAPGESGAARRVYYDEAELLAQPPSFLDMSDDGDAPKRTGMSRYNIFSGSEGRLSLPRHRRSVSKVLSTTSSLSRKSAKDGCEMEVDVLTSSSSSLVSLDESSFGDCLVKFPDVPLRRVVNGLHAFAVDPPEAASWRKTEPTQTPASNDAPPDTPSTPSLSPRSSAASDSTFSTPSNVLLTLEQYPSHDHSAPLPGRSRSFTSRRPHISRIPPRSSPPTRPLPPIPHQSRDHHGLYSTYI